MGMLQKFAGEVTEFFCESSRIFLGKLQDFSALVEEFGCALRNLICGVAESYTRCRGVLYATPC